MSRRSSLRSCSSESRDAQEHERKIQPKNLKDVYLLKGIGVCACGRTIQCYRDQKSQYRLYRCPERNIEGVSEKTCPIHSLRADFVEKILITELKRKWGTLSFSRFETS